MSNIQLRRIVSDGSNAPVRFCDDTGPFINAFNVVKTDKLLKLQESLTLAEDPWLQLYLLDFPTPL